MNLYCCLPFFILPFIVSFCLIASSIYFKLHIVHETVFLSFDTRGTETVNRRQNWKIQAGIDRCANVNQIRKFVKFSLSSKSQAVKCFFFSISISFSQSTLSQFRRMKNIRNLLCVNFFFYSARIMWVNNTQSSAEVAIDWLCLSFAFLLSKLLNTHNECVLFANI